MVATKRWLMNRARVIVVALVCSTASDASAQDFKADVVLLNSPDSACLSWEFRFSGMFRRELKQVKRS